MAKFKLSDVNGFRMIQPGTHIFKIVAASYDEDFGKIEVKMQTKDGQTHTERFTVLTNEGEVNDGAMRAFSFFAKTALNDFKIDEIDVEELAGRFIKCEVKHVQSTSINPKTNKPYVNVQLGDKFSCNGFEGMDEDIDDLDEDLDDLD